MSRFAALSYIVFTLLLVVVIRETKIADWIVDFWWR